MPALTGPRAARVALLALLAIACLVFPLAASPFALRVAQTLLFGAALATAWNILGGFAGYWSFGNSAFLGLGAFAAALMQEHTPIDDPMLRLVVGLVAGGGATTFLALIIGYPILRLRGAYFAIAMLGISLALAELSSSVDLFEGALGVTVAPITDAAPEKFFYYVFLGLAAASLVIGTLVRYARLGYGLIAIREDEDTARMLGVPTEHYKLFGFVLSAFITGLVGAAYAFSLGYITTNSVFRTDISFNVIVYALLGGIGTIAGPTLGAAVMTLLTQVALADLLQVHMMMTGFAIVALVFLMPNGLMGLRRSTRVSPPTEETSTSVNVAALGSPPAEARLDGRPILRLVGLSKQFRGLRAIDDVAIDIAPGRISSIIGPNGAGKSTLFNMVTGYLAPTSGEIWYEDERIDGIVTYRLSRRGIARAFQVAKPFAGLSVYENVLVGALFGRDGSRDPHRETEVALALVGLTERSNDVASSLPVGHLRRLEIARVVATRPKLVLADEPCAGLNPTETLEMMAILNVVRTNGATVVLVEHDMRAVMEISDEIFVIAAGRLIAHGVPRDVVRNPAVIEAYLGKPLTAGDGEGALPLSWAPRGAS